MLNVKCQRFIIWSFSLSLYVYNTVFIFRTNLMRRRIKCCYTNNAIQTENSKFKMMILFIESARIEFVLFLIFSLHSHGHLYQHIYSYNFVVAIIVFAVLLTIFYASYFSFLAWKTFDIINWLPKQKRSSLLAGRSIVYFVSYCIISYCIEKIYHKQRLCVN